MSATDELERAIASLKALRPSDLKARVREWQRGGLPATSIPGGRGGSESPPMVDDRDNVGDRFDIWLRAQLRTVETNIGLIVNLAAAAERAQNAVMLKAEAVPEEVPIDCSNIACREVLEPGRKKGECSKCRVHRSRHDMAWPQKRETA